ncbi:MAG: arginine--tRNA ligase [SAR86 cluster bacterium]|uniref:Arginine--tRNA ligase n=1 Tax=SAR86 cluster bacterium TaxID=2030880 RepID=A0A2A5B3J2_9GAMM|nr:MAG: arginine--tRNA ligase [SAR86 cluster bacterium]
METLKQTLNNLVSTCLTEVSGIADCNANVITASRPEFGDYQANGVMSIAKQLKTNPRQLATQVAELLETQGDALIDHVDIAGPGFINIHLSSQALIERADLILNENSLLIPATLEAQTIVVDYSSPNLAKEMHVGHLRGTIIGDCLARVLERQGHRVLRQNHVGDWGTQFGMLIAYMREVKTENEDLPTQLADLESFYRAAKQRFDDDSAFAEIARASVVKLQSGDADHRAVWEQFIEESLLHCHAVYERLNVTLSRKDLKAESFYNNELEGIVSKLDSTGLLTVSDGARCVFLEEFTGKDGTPLPVIIQKSDGGYLYATTDLAAVKYRSFDLKADRSLYVVDARQSLHFQQVFAVAKAAGFSSGSISLEHIAYGTMMGSDGRPFKTRSGDTIKLVDLLDESVRRAFDLVSQKNPSLEESARQLIADKVGIAAVKYADLSKNRTSDYIFDWSTMLSFEGNTAPYLMYAYARIKSILRKQSVILEKYEITSLSEQEERNLLIKILQLAEVIEMVANDGYPNLLCNYLYELAGSFMRFYESCPILKAEGPLRDSRLSLAALTADTLHQGLDLLGIETLEQM